MDWACREVCALTCLPWCWSMCAYLYRGRATPLLYPARLASLWKLATTSAPTCVVTQGPSSHTAAPAALQGTAKALSEADYQRLLSSYLLQVQKKCSSGPHGLSRNELSQTASSGGAVVGNRSWTGEHGEASLSGNTFALLPAHWLSTAGQHSRS